ncbi:UDP-glucose 6-dehydrogenase TuaD [compost metagenome]
MKAARELMEGVEFAQSAYEVAEGAEAVVLVTEWNEFRSLDLERLKVAMQTPIFVDLRNVYRPHEMRRHGFTYVSIGRSDADLGDQVPEAAE